MEWVNYTPNSSFVTCKNERDRWTETGREIKTSSCEGCIILFKERTNIVAIRQSYRYGVCMLQRKPLIPVINIDCCRTILMIRKQIP